MRDVVICEREQLTAYLPYLISIHTAPHPMPRGNSASADIPYCPCIIMHLKSSGIHFVLEGAFSQEGLGTILEL